MGEGTTDRRAEGSQRRVSVSSSDQLHRRISANNTISGIGATKPPPRGHSQSNHSPATSLHHKFYESGAGQGAKFGGLWKDPGRKPRKVMRTHESPRDEGGGESC